MAPVDGSIALSHVNGISDAARARELYKYVHLSLWNGFTDVSRILERDTKVHRS